MRAFEGRAAFITGGSRGIGLEIGKALARRGARVAIAAKTATTHPSLPGTVFSAAEEIRAAGGEALPIVCDIRDASALEAAIDQAAATFGGLDILVNNASAIALTPTLDTEAKRMDLMFQINTRGTLLASKFAARHLRNGTNPHILSLAPPLDLKPEWFAPYLPYAIAKFGMSLCTLGLAEELRPLGIAVNALWPRTTIATAAVRNVVGDDAMIRRSRSPAIMADAAVEILRRDARRQTGGFLIDDEVLYEAGQRDFDRYRIDPACPLELDLFLSPESVPGWLDLGPARTA